MRRQHRSRLRIRPAVKTPQSGTPSDSGERSAYSRARFGGRVARFRLYVDETGQTDRRGAEWLGVAGVLVPEGGFTQPVLSAARRALQSKYPWLSWPFHRTSF